MGKKVSIYTIDSDVPMPKWKAYNTSLPPMLQLNVGESILFPIEKREMVQSVASRYKRSHGVKFSIRKVDDNSARIWRVE